MTDAVNEMKCKISTYELTPKPKKDPEMDKAKKECKENERK